jgi:hypothetical protein
MISTLFRLLVRAVPRASVVIVNHATAMRVAGACHQWQWHSKRSFATDALVAPFSDVMDQIRLLEKELAKELVHDRVKLETRLENLQALALALAQMEAALAQKEAALAQKEAAVAASPNVLSEKANELVRAADDASKRDDATCMLSCSTHALR